MPRRIPWSLLVVAGIVLAGVSLVLVTGVSPKKPPVDAAPAPPQDVSVTMDFQDGPNLVFLCWAHAGSDVTFYDVGVEAFTGGQPRLEVGYGVTTTACGEALGTGEYMFGPDLYHFAVRACNNAGCSEWADASAGSRYWFAIPCADPSGDKCARSAELATGGR